MQFAHNLLCSKHLKPYIKEIHKYDIECPYEYNSVEYWECVLSHFCYDSYHNVSCYFHVFAINVRMDD